MKLLFAYWKQRRGVILVFVLCAAVRFGVFALYRLPLAAVGYGELLCAAIGVVALVAMTPLITIQVLGLVYQLQKKRSVRRQTVLAPEQAFDRLDDDAIIDL